MKGQRVVIEVDARRLGSALDPIVELLDERRSCKIAWSQKSFDWREMLG
ncbi:MAG: hypothetical protein U1D30_05450 [Planctomycetota bacterium]